MQITIFSCDWTTTNLRKKRKEQHIILLEKRLKPIEASNYAILDELRTET